MEWSEFGTQLPGRDEFVKLIKSDSISLSNDTEWKDRRHSRVTPPVRDQESSALIASPSLMQDGEYNDLKSEENHTRILASLVPDEILENIDDYSIRPYESVFLFGDISGFTELSEKYNKPGQGGSSRLTQMLNSYIGAMVQEILSHNGDVLKFSGDAFFAMWKNPENGTMEDLVHEALDCALIIQKTYGSYLTDVGVTLRVKIIISSGPCVFSIIGDENVAHYIAVGEPIRELKGAEHWITAGDIVCAPSAWRHINPAEFIHEFGRYGVYIKVLGTGPGWKATHVNEVKYHKTDTNGTRKSSSSSSGTQDTKDLSSVANQKAINEQRQEFSFEVDNFRLRPMVDEAVKNRLKDKLRRFIVAPVMRGIDLNEPLKYLTEMRHVVILFINIITEEITILQKYVFLVDAAYKAIVRIVSQSQGCVNKVSLFDKDLMILSIFGLRGFKNQLECQVGLRCAYDIREHLMTLPGIISVSCAVTTGLTYCGVVGHNLRREYTVISLIVNKAARLMMAYPNKVVCDRETFIRSKLEGRNFILQEPKELKGLTNVGPIYKFVEQSGVVSNTIAISSFPLLGRETEIDIYFDLLARRSRDLRRVSTVPSNKTSIMFRGEPRQGKTRLLDELVYLTPSSIPVHRIFLRPKDVKVPFATIDLIFGVLLGDSEKIQRWQREENIVKRLRRLEVQEVLCALNDILKVEFEVTEVYKTLKVQERQEVKRKLIKQLVHSCFSTLWVMTIDDAEFIDDASWLILLYILKLPNLVLIFTLGVRRQLSNIGVISANSAEIMRHTLGPLSKWFHAGLACQILDVKAIPAELERVIHTRSNGNPGWIESYLISLSQAGGTLIQTLPREDVLELGLVIPPTEMTTRVLESTAENWRDRNRMSIIDYRSKSYRQEYTWKMFHRCYKDSVADFRDYQSNLQEKGAVHGHIIRVCVFAPSFNIEDIDFELPIDVIILRTFDSLTSNEKVLLKCSSILGDAFLRSMLMYVMSGLSVRETALAVKKLFESRVLACAKGDFTTEDRLMLNKNNSFTRPSNVLECQCQGLKIDPTCEDLPKYASCGFLRFGSSGFRDTAHNLLTDNQRKEFHGRAIRYLEKETRRCNSCGRSYFTRLVGFKMTDDSMRSRQPFIELEDILSERLSVASFSSTSVRMRLFQTSKQTNSYLIYQPKTWQRFRSTVSDLQQLQDKHKKARDKFKKVSMKFNMMREMAVVNGVRKFSNIHFLDCQCNFILHVYYTQMLEHCKGAGRYSRLLETNLEYASLCINDQNFQLAICLLRDSLDIMARDVIEINEDSTWTIPVKYGRIFLLLGKTLLKTGQIESSLDALQQAMRFFGYPFPTSTAGILYQKTKQQARQKLMLQYFPNWFIRTKTGELANYVQYKSECLAAMFGLFKSIHKWHAAELAAIWSLNEALKSDMNFQCLCEAYANQIDVSNFRPIVDCSVYEHLAILLCNRKVGKMESEELRTVAYLYYILFNSKFTRGTVAEAKQIGYTAFDICKTVRDIKLLTRIIITLIFTLTSSKSFFEYVDRVHDLVYYSEEDTSNSCRTFFYGFCIGFVLNTGFIIIPLTECEQYFCTLGETTHWNNVSEQYYYIGLWCWFVRTSSWDDVMILYSKVKHYYDPDFIQAIPLDHLFLTLRLLEPSLILAVHFSDTGNYEKLAAIIPKIETCMKFLEEKIFTVVCFAPRLLHLKAYYSIISNGGKKYLTYLKRGKAKATQLGNFFDLGWMEHSEVAWAGKMPSMLMDQWLEYTSSIPMHYRSMQSNKPVYYTLPLPDKPIKPP